MQCNRGKETNGAGWVHLFLIPFFWSSLLAMPSHLYGAEMDTAFLSEHFVDGMTLPAYKTIEVSGQGPEGRTIDVKLVRNNVTVTMARVTVKSDNSWHVSLNEQSPGGPYQLKVIDQKHVELVNDIYIGQKNIEISNPAGALVLSTALSDDMHIQPGEEIKVNGLAAPGSSLDIKLTKQKTTYTMARVQAAGDGQWQVTMPGQNAGGPFQLIVTNGRHKKVVSGIIIGQADVKEVATNPIKEEFLALDFDDSAWPSVKLTSLESQPNDQALLVRKHFNFASTPKAVSFSLGDNHQVKQIYINGKLLETKDWQSNPQNIPVPSSMFQSGANLVALISNPQWDNTRFIGTTGRFTVNINKLSLDFKSNWRAFNSSTE